MSQEIPQLKPIETYRERAVTFQPLEWSSDLQLTEGTVLIFGHANSDRTYIFESLQATVNKSAAGLLTIGEGAKIVDDRLPATMSLLHPAIGLSQTGAAYAEFYFLQGDAKCRIVPPLGSVEVVHSDELANYARQRRILHERREPFNGEGVNKTISDLVAFYSTSAELSTDQVEKDSLEMLAARLSKDFLTD